jgi:hypothetical protein
VSYAGNWEVEPDYLEIAVKALAEDRPLSELEFEQIEAWVQRAQDGPYVAGGTPDPDEPLLTHVRLPETNLVVTYSAEFTYRKIIVSSIVDEGVDS